MWSKPLRCLWYFIFFNNKLFASSGFIYGYMIRKTQFSDVHLYQPEDHHVGGRCDNVIAGKNFFAQSPV